MATKFNLTTGRAMPSAGLTTSQIVEGLAGMGYEPLLYGEFEQLSPGTSRELVYYHVESGIPAALSICFPFGGGHAVTVIGHLLDIGAPPTVHSLVTGFEFHLTSDFVPGFIVQDDAGGPFRIAEFLPIGEALQDTLVQAEVLRDPEFAKEVLYYSRLFECAVILDRGTVDQQIGFLAAATVPLPPRVTLECRMAEQHVLALLATHRDLVLDSQRKLTLRTFLQSSNDFKKASLASRGMNADQAYQLRRHVMPKWLWVTEVAYLDELRSSSLIIGQVVQDGGGRSGDAWDTDLVAVQLPGKFTLGHPQGSLEECPELASLHQSFRRFEEPIGRPSAGQSLS